MHTADTRGDVESALALLAQPSLADLAQVSVRQDEGAFSATIESRVELQLAGGDECEQSLALAADQAYRSVLAAGGHPDPALQSLEFLVADKGWLARASVHGRINDIRKLATPSFVEAGDFAYVLGSASNSDSLHTLYAAIRAGVSGRMLRTCRALGVPGGLAFGIAAACLQGSLGLQVLMDDLPGAPADAESLLFGTEGSRCIAGVRREDRERFERSFTGLPHRLLGVLTREPGISFSRDGRKLLTLQAEQSVYTVAAHW